MKPHRARQITYCSIMMITVVLWTSIARSCQDVPGAHRPPHRAQNGKSDNFYPGGMLLASQKNEHNALFLKVRQAKLISECLRNCLIIIIMLNTFSDWEEYQVGMNVDNSVLRLRTISLWGMENRPLTLRILRSSAGTALPLV